MNTKPALLWLLKEKADETRSGHAPPYNVVQLITLQN